MLDEMDTKTAENASPENVKPRGEIATQKNNFVERCLSLLSNMQYTELAKVLNTSIHLHKGTNDEIKQWEEVLSKVFGIFDSKYKSAREVLLRATTVYSGGLDTTEYFKALDVIQMLLGPGLTTSKNQPCLSVFFLQQYKEWISSLNQLNRQLAKTIYNCAKNALIRYNFLQVGQCLTDLQILAMAPSEVGEQARCDIKNLQSLMKTKIDNLEADLKGYVAEVGEQARCESKNLQSLVKTKQDNLEADLKGHKSESEPCKANCTCLDPRKIDRLFDGLSRSESRDLSLFQNEIGLFSNMLGVFEQKLHALYEGVIQLQVNEHAENAERFRFAFRKLSKSGTSNLD